MEATLAEADTVVVATRPLGFEPFGTVVPELPADVAGKTVYLTGDLAQLAADPRLAGAARVRAIVELSHGDTNGADGMDGMDGSAGTPGIGGAAIERVTLGQVPVRIGGAGAYFRRLFADRDYFRLVAAEHAFQTLTESVKPSKAHRTGIYLTPVERHNNNELHFHLLRCSTNLSGPTESFCATDRHIVDTVSREAALIFRDHAQLNHALAQIYPNTAVAKAKISAHADKTKDMPANGIMAFCTFYDGTGKLAPLAADPFDLGYKTRSGLTRLQFRAKAPRAGLTPAFSIPLYPGSVFLMPLSTNRLYTHEIQASVLDADMLPTRLGYVVRCSKTRAVHAAGATFLDTAAGRVPLESPTPEGMAALRELYAAENRSDAVIDYGDRFRFSMNQGDYTAPDLKA